VTVNSVSGKSLSVNSVSGKSVSGKAATDKLGSGKSVTDKVLSAKLVSGRFEWRNSIILRSTNVGKGLFARKLFRKRQAIGHMKGKLITGDDYDPDYVVDMGELGVLEPQAPFRYLNHSCEPNCELLEWQSKAEPYPQIWVHALRTVRPTEQLTIDYGWPAESAIPCLCGSPSCRGWVVDVKDLPRLLKMKKKQAQQSC